MPLLRRTHDRHRDLRGRLSATPQADRASPRHQDRHLIARAPPPFLVPPSAFRAGHRPATPMLGPTGVQPGFHHRSHRREPSSSGLQRSRSAAPAGAITRLPRSRTLRPLSSPWSNRHSAAPSALHFPRVPSLEACRRRPRASGNARDGPASRTLHMSSHYVRLAELSRSSRSGATP